MLTVKQPPTYGYKSVHDLPTPPSTSRPSPPLIYREPANNSLPVAYRGHSPPSQPMSAPHRGLPPPAAMTLPPQQPPAAGAPPSTHLPPHPPPPPPPQPSLGPPGHQQRDSWGQLPAPPQQWQGAEESMRHWLQARAEEDKRKQEEERTKQEEARTRQESLRLEQRKVEMDMLRTSLQAGIPPPMVPLVFAGMGGGGVAPQAALEWAQQFMPPGQAPPRAQIMPAQWPVSPEHQREPQTLSHTHAQHPGIPSASTPAAGYVYPPSPSRPRSQTVSGAIGRPMGISTLPSLNTNVPQPAHAPPMHSHQHPHMQQAQQQQQEPQSSPSIYFHHWQPPTSQASGSSNRPGSPSGETPRKRKATGHHAPSPARSEQRYRSPPPLSQSGSSSAAFRGSRRGHSRQRSDMSPFRVIGPGRSRRESFGGPLRRMSPIRSSTSIPSQERPGSENKQSVSAILSEEPPPGTRYPGPRRPSEERENRYKQPSPGDSKPHRSIEETSKSRENSGEGQSA
ncbi:hypothetical protein Focb16_v006641 [Fusarium oxysporum f. sp. cubense]|uniref:Uncharacterized protein n=1 Tax=Fusarium oxysporum f. sp. cubense TaxID=61366 RepID=A0A559LPV2_FUSOC|nr:hypothetical protein Focb16_v006641 [Fusarium oxysporum f. sp. cubense]